MTRLFYEKHVPQDPMLAPVFANMSADHPQRVAKWLGEVLGGPPCYSEEYGGYSRMISEHLGKCLTEEWRARWVSLLLQSAREAGLPNDPEFSSAFQAYIEWGSRLAVENSATDARSPEHMPMPRWDWNTAAGPPGTRMPRPAPNRRGSRGARRAARRRRARALPEAHQAALPGSRPAIDEVRLRPLVPGRRQAERRGRLERVENGSMPCDGTWPQETVAVLRRWINTGMSA